MWRAPPCGCSRCELQSFLLPFLPFLPSFLPSSLALSLASSLAPSLPPALQSVGMHVPVEPSRLFPQQGLPSACTQTSKNWHSRVAYTRVLKGLLDVIVC